MAAGPGEVMLGYAHNGTVRAEFMASMMRLQTDPATLRLIGRVVSNSGANLISYARNKLTEEFLNSPCQWLFMVDADITFSPMQLTHLAAYADAQQRPVIAAPVAVLTAAGTGTGPNLFTAERDAAGVVTKFIPLAAMPASGLIQVDACGAAFTMIHRSVLEKMGPGEWFRESVTPSGGIRGEDLSFCIRVTEAGFPIWAACGIRPGHMKTVCITAD